MPQLVLLRHGQSLWNAENLFTGWYDVDLSVLGEEEARGAGELLAADGLDLRVVHTSVLTRAIRTADLALDAAGRPWLPVRRHWRLNERHYGALQGLNKKETAAEHGEAQVKEWQSEPQVEEADLHRADALRADKILSDEDLGARQVQAGRDDRRGRSVSRG